MPNWCEGDLTIWGSCKRLFEFKKFADDNGKVLTMEKFIPYPESFKVKDRQAEIFNKETEQMRLAGEDVSNRDYQKDGFNSGGYEWCISNRGTKWDFVNPWYDEDHSEIVENLEQDGTIVYHFDTAWSPPLPVILKMSEMFQGLEFELRYFEAGMSFNGLYRCKDGQVLYDETGNYYGSRGG